MKKILTIISTVILFGLSSCVSESGCIETKYNLIGTYTNDNIPDFIDILIIKPDNSFTEYQGHNIYQVEWLGEWVYDKENNIITLHYLIERYDDNNVMREEYLENDYCWAQPYYIGNAMYLRYKEYWTDSWEDYFGFVKTSNKYN